MAESVPPQASNYTAVGSYDEDDRLRGGYGAVGMGSRSMSNDSLGGGASGVALACTPAPDAHLQHLLTRLAASSLAARSGRTTVCTSYCAQRRSRMLPAEVML